MSEKTLTVFQCKGCGATLFPARYLCPRCGAADWREQAAPRGTLEECTVVRHRVGAQAHGGVPLASVRTDAGPVVVARLDAAGRPGRPGDAVTLWLDDAMRVLARAAD